MGQTLKFGQKMRKPYKERTLVKMEEKKSSRSAINKTRDDFTIRILPTQINRDLKMPQKK